MNDVHVDCAKCGVQFCLTPALYRRRKADGADFYCPNGHANVYRPTVDQKRIAELEQQLRMAERREQHRFRDFEDAYTTREELIGAIKECPGGCGWRSRKQIPRDPVAMGRGLERVRLDVAEHLVRVHGARPEPVRELEQRT